MKSFFIKIHILWLAKDLFMNSPSELKRLEQQINDLTKQMEVFGIIQKGGSRSACSRKVYPYEVEYEASYEWSKRSSKKNGYNVQEEFLPFNHKRDNINKLERME